MSKSDNLFAIPLAIYLDNDRLEGFNSQTPVIDNFLHNEARESDNEGLTATTIIVNSENDIVGYYTLNMGTQEIKRTDTHSSYMIPYVNISYLAVDFRYQKKGYGNRIVKYIYRKLVPSFMVIGFSYIFVQSLSDSVSFYKKAGFEMDEKTEKTFETQGIKLETYDMFIKIDKVITLL